MRLAAKEETSFPLAALARNSHPGHQLPTAALHPGIGFVISNTATSFHASLYDFCSGPRCSSKERDSETGLDYFGARYFSSAQGRFTSPDWSATPQPVPYADLSNPQSLNLYNYMRNNPLSGTDPDGHCCWDWIVEKATNAANAWNSFQQENIRNNTEYHEALRQQLGDAGYQKFIAISVAGAGTYALGAEVISSIPSATPQTGTLVSEEGTVTRYMGPGEAKVATTTGEIPNANAQGEFRPTHVTTDAPTNSASEAQTKYELPSPPTHRATVPGSRVNDLQVAPDGRTQTSGGGSQAATHKPIPVKPQEIKPLNQ